MTNPLMRYLLPILLSISFIFSVGEAGAVFLLISPSPIANGYGGSGASVPTFDIYSSFYNPAHSLIPLGASFQFSRMETAWLPNLADDLSLEYEVQSIGYNGFDLGENFRLQLLISELKTNLNLGEQLGTDEMGNELGIFRSYMKANSSTLSVGIQSNRYPVFFSIGRTTKTAKQVLTDAGTGFGSGGGSPSSLDSFSDWGFRLLIDDFEIPRINSLTATCGVGYSKSNIGDFIYFDGYSSQGDPAPRNARLGLTVGFKINILDNYNIELKAIREVEDLLVTATESERVYQDGLLGDINILKHIIGGKADEEVTIHRGMELTLFDFYSVRTGSLIDIAGKIEATSVGHSINIGNYIGILGKLLFFSDKLNALNYFNIEYSYSREFAGLYHARDNISYSDLRISINNIDKLLFK